jgi:hypothetical protein
MNGIKFVKFGAVIVVAALCLTAQVNAMSVSAASGLSQVVTLNDGTTGVPMTDLAVLGIFKNGMSNAQIQALWTGTSVSDIANITAAFSVEESGVIGPDAAGEVSIANANNAGAGYFTSNAFVIVYNNASAALATQILVLKGPTVGGSGDPWTFPATDGAAGVSFSLDDIGAANVLIGGFDGATTYNDGSWFAPASASMIMAAVVPEPSTYALVAMGLLGAWGMRRRRS